MKRPSFLQGVIVAALFALVGSIGLAGLSIVLGGAVALQIVTTALGGAYIVYLLSQSNERTGRIAIITACGAPRRGGSLRRLRACAFRCELEREYAALLAQLLARVQGRASARTPGRAD